MNKVNISQIAQEAGVSVATVSRTFSERQKVSPVTRERILKVAQKYEYSPRVYQHTTRAGISGIVGMVVPDLHNQYYMDVIEGAERVLNEQNIELLICNTNEDAVKEIRSLSVIRHIHALGVIITPVSSAERYNVDFITELNRSGIPVVLLDRDWQECTLDGVFMQNYQAGYQGTELLIQNGHRNIAIICGPAHSSSAEQRIAGYKDVMKKYGLEIRDELLIRGDFKVEMAYRQTRRFLETNTDTTAIFSCNSRMTQGCLMALAEANLQVGRDIALIGCGRPPAGFEASITSILYPTQEIGEKCASMILNRIHSRKSRKANPVRCLFDLQLKICGSEKYPDSKR